MALTDVTDGSRVIEQGMMPYKITLTDTCDVGDLIGYDADDGKWERADANAKVYADFVAGEPCRESGDTITVFRQAIVTGFSAGVVGNPVYLGDTAGEYEDIPDSYGYQQIVGVCLSTTEVMVEPRAAVGVFGMNRQSLGWAGYIRSEIQDETTTDIWGGLRIDCKAVGGTLSGDVYGLYVFMQLDATPTSSSAIIRLEDGCSTSDGVDSYIMCICATSDPPDFLFELGPLAAPTNSAWDLNNNSSLTAAGRLKIKVGGSTRYISINSD